MKQEFNEFCLFKISFSSLIVKSIFSGQAVVGLFMCGSQKYTYIWYTYVKVKIYINMIGCKTLGLQQVLGSTPPLFEGKTLAIWWPRLGDAIYNFKEIGNCAIWWILWRVTAHNGKAHSDMMHLVVYMFSDRQQKATGSPSSGLLQHNGYKNELNN